MSHHHFKLTLLATSLGAALIAPPVSAQWGAATQSQPADAKSATAGVSATRPHGPASGSPGVPSGGVDRASGEQGMPSGAMSATTGSAQDARGSGLASSAAVKPTTKQAGGWGAGSAVTPGAAVSRAGIGTSTGAGTATTQAQAAAGFGASNTGWQSHGPGGATGKTSAGGASQFSGGGNSNAAALAQYGIGAGGVGKGSQGGMGAGPSGVGAAGPHLNNGGMAGEMEGSGGKKNVGNFDDNHHFDSGSGSEVTDTKSDSGSSLWDSVKQGAKDAYDWVTGGSDSSSSSTSSTSSTKVDDPKTVHFNNTDGSGGFAVGDDPDGDTGSGGANAQGHTFNGGNKGGGDGGGQGSDAGSGGSGGANAQGHTFNGGTHAGGDAPLTKPDENAALNAGALNNGVTDPARGGGAIHH